MRRTAPLAFALALLAGGASAGDFATLAPVGFSPDGRLFVFEQHGVQDGSGFPYSQIVAIDTGTGETRQSVAVRLEEDGASLADARRQAREAAGAALGDLAAFEPGLLAAANPPTELSADPYRLVFRPRAVEPSPDAPVELRLSLVPFFGADESCTVFGHTVNGFRLVRVSAEPGEAARLLHADEEAPADRRCPYDYRIAELRVHTDASWNLSAVALVGIVQVGFEGPDMRYMAVPVPLD